MSDFLIDDQVTTLLVTAQNQTASDWLDHFMSGRGHEGPNAVRLPPGFLAHTVLPAIREAGFTAGGDVNEKGEIVLRVQT